MSEIIGEYSPEPMELYIRIVDGQPVDHPILGDNLRHALGIDTNNLPPEFARFVRIANSTRPRAYEVSYVKYEWVGDIVKDVFYIRPMNEQERQEYRDMCYAYDHPEGYIFNEDNAQWMPNIELSGGTPDVIA
jgi:hypothetical protein